MSDQIDVVTLLGRPAERVMFADTTTPGVTEVELVLNTMTIVNVENIETVDSSISSWASNTSTVYSDAPKAVLSENDFIGIGGELQGLPITSLEVIGLTALQTGDLIIW
jgi:hypothetical protein